MANSVDVTKIPKLNGANYCDWRSLLKDILVLKDLWGPLFAAAPADPANLATWNRSILIATTSHSHCITHHVSQMD